MTIGNIQQYPGAHIVPASINVIYGNPNGGSVADIQNWQDGNVLDLTEAASANALRMEMIFNNINSFQRIGLSMYYDGSATHWVQQEIWDKIDMAWKQLTNWNTCKALDYRFVDLPIDAQRFIDNGTVKLRIDHPQSGNAAHNMFIDYVALVL
jgi:hypothetical protein